MKSETALVDIHIGPDAFDQFSLADDLARPLRKEDENIERTATDMDGRAVLLQESRLWKQPERAEGNGCFFGAVARHALCLFFEESFRKD
jgi:hypothetical protein